MEKLLRWLNLLLVLVTLSSYLSPFIDPGTFWWFSFLGMGYPWLLLFNMLFVLWWLFVKNWYFLFSLACIISGWNHFQSFVGMNAPLVDEKTDLTVMTLNSMTFYNLKGETGKKFQQLLQKHEPDIICLQEAYSSYKPFSKKTYPYIYQPKEKSLVIYSKLPFVQRGNLDMGNKTNGCTFVDVKLKNKLVRFYNVHLQSNKVTDNATKLKKEGNLKEKETWIGIKKMLDKVKRASTIRSRQVKEIIEHFLDCKHPVVVCGDMNDTPLSYTYQLFSQHLEDGFKKRAMGIGTTFDGTIPVLRIDYIFTDPKFEVNSHHIIKENFSDHYPVISSIRFK